ncbi:hypothetical protein DH2020_020017 [Rehmannia glutinosa]|uniref:Transposase (putative) gypsy type domain-containing protein n=1 Tax=Rehmannia glutinosa TaxID=99300 RepID=A0ABR0WH46_REHGL
MSSPINLSSTGTSTDPEISRFSAWVDDLELSFENAAPSASHNTEDSSSNLPASSGSISDRSYSNVEIRPAIPTSHVDSAFNATTMFARNLKYLCKNISIPPSFKLALPSFYDRPNRPPPGFLAFFSGQIDGGLRFPIHPLMAELSVLYQIPLNQFSPNSFRLMTGFVMVTKFLEIEPTAELFHSLFQIKVSTTRGLFYLSSRGDARFLGKYPTSNKFWKDRYFFLSSPEPWPFPTRWVWEVPPRKKVNIRRRDPDLQVLIDRLNKQEYDLSRLCSCPALLWHFKLSHTPAKLEDDLATTMNKRLAEKEAARKRNISMSRAPSQGTSSNPQSIQPPPSITSAQTTEDQAPKSPRTIRPDSARDVIRELTDPSNNPIPKKRPLSALDSSQKKSKTVGSSGDTTTPNQTFFLQSPVMENLHPRTAAEFLQGLCPARERRPLQQASASDLVDNFSLDFSKALLRLSEIVARGRVGFADPELVNERNDLKHQLAKIKERDAKMLKTLDKSKTELEEHKAALARKDEEIGALKTELKKFQLQSTRQIAEAREEGARASVQNFLQSPECCALVQKAREVAKQSFLSSEEFLDVLSDGALQYFHMAFNQAEAQGLEKGFTEKFDRNKALTFATDPEGYNPSAEANRVNLSSHVDFLNHILSLLKADRASSSAPLAPPPSSGGASQALATEGDATIKILDEAPLTVADYSIKDTPLLAFVNVILSF